jgi:hypothetical protein
MKGGTMYLRRRASDICFSVSEREIKRQASNQSTEKSPFAEKMESAQGRTTRSGFCAV